MISTSFLNNHFEVYPWDLFWSQVYPPVDVRRYAGVHMHVFHTGIYGTGPRRVTYMICVFTREIK